MKQNLAFPYHPGISHIAPKTLTTSRIVRLIVCQKWRSPRGKNIFKGLTLHPSQNDPIIVITDENVVNGVLCV